MVQKSFQVGIDFANKVKGTWKYEVLLDGKVVEMKTGFKTSKEAHTAVKRRLRRRR